MISPISCQGFPPKSCQKFIAESLPPAGWEGKILSQKEVQAPFAIFEPPFGCHKHLKNLQKKTKTNECHLKSHFKLKGSCSNHYCFLRDILVFVGVRVRTIIMIILFHENSGPFFELGCPFIHGNLKVPPRYKPS